MRKQGIVGGKDGFEMRRREAEVLSLRCASGEGRGGGKRIGVWESINLWEEISTLEKIRSSEIGKCRAGKKKQKERGEKKER